MLDSAGRRAGGAVVGDGGFVLHVDCERYFKTPGGVIEALNLETALSATLFAEEAIIRSTDGAIVGLFSPSSRVLALVPNRDQPTVGSADIGGLVARTMLLVESARSDHQGHRWYAIIEVVEDGSRIGLVRQVRIGFD